MSKKRQIVNIINFIRAYDPRNVTKEMLLEVVREQIALADAHGLKTTFMIQYDAMLDKDFTDLLLPLDPVRYEIGLWHELCEAEATACGLPWTGDYPWDWHCHCDFPVGYSKEGREALADEAFRLFKEVFGYYPKVFGSWFFDSHTLRYIAEKYGLDACCNCKEQYGTDGYTLWGSYYGQGYYPSSTNCFMPAQTEAERLDVPLFRMLGSDPVYQFDLGMSPVEGASTCQEVVTLEPVYCGGAGGGGVPKWTDWYMKENFNGDCLSFGYAQAGQENSFTWPRMAQGLRYQYPLFAKLQQEGKIVVETFGETGRWFKEAYRDTPPSAITAHSAFDDPDKRSVWYSTKEYRINLYNDGTNFRIRDLHIFDERVPDPYETTICTANDATYETLPVVDGNLFTGNGILSGVYFENGDGTGLETTDMTFTDLGGGRAEVTFGALTFLLGEKTVEISGKQEFAMEHRIGCFDKVPEVVSWTEREITLRYQNTDYGLRLTEGKFVSAWEIVSENGRVKAEVVNGERG